MYLPSNKLNSKGFTLIELLIVISVVGILSGIVISVVNPSKQQARARDGVLVTVMNKIQAEVEAAANADVSGVGAYPACNVLSSNLQNVLSQCASGGTTFTMKGVTTDGTTATVFTYKPVASPKSFCLSAPASDTSGGAFIKMDNGAAGLFTPTRAAAGC